MLAYFRVLILMGTACHLLYGSKCLGVEADNVRGACVGTQEAVSAFSFVGVIIYR